MKYRLGTIDGGLGTCRERNCFYFIVLTDIEFPISESDG